MTTELYKVFYYVAESRSISKASKKLFVSQPAVSKAVKNLEEELGLPLFIRTAKGVELTIEGEFLYKHVSLAFMQLNEGQKLIKQLKERSLGTIRIGVSNTLCRYYFMPHLKNFHQAFPKLKIEIINRTSPETMALLEEGRLDFAIISDVSREKFFDYHKLLEINDIFVSKRRPPKDILPIKALEDYPMLLLEKKNATRDHLDRFLYEYQIELNVDIEISSMEFLIEFAKIGLGVATVIGDFVKPDLADETLYEWKTKPSIPTRTVGLLSKKNATLSIASRTFFDFMLGTIDNKL